EAPRVRGLAPLVARLRAISSPSPGWRWHLGGIHQVAGRFIGPEPSAPLSILLARIIRTGGGGRQEVREVPLRRHAGRAVRGLWPHDIRRRHAEGPALTARRPAFRRA